MAVNSRHRNRNQRAAGLRFLLIGAIGIAIGVVVVIVAEGLPEGIGYAIASLSSVPTLAGVGLLLTSVVEKRSRDDKPFA